MQRTCDACRVTDDLPRHKHVDFDPTRGHVEMSLHFSCCAERGCPLSGQPGDCSTLIEGKN